MTCCGKKVKEVFDTAKAIAVGYTNLAVGKKYEFTDGRIKVCQKCEKNYWIKKTLWCSICKCYIPAKARVESEKCPLGKWKE